MPKSANNNAFLPNSVIAELLWLRKQRRCRFKRLYAGRREKHFYGRKKPH
jgi:hypothetical protein